MWKLNFTCNVHFTWWSSWEINRSWVVRLHLPQESITPPETRLMNLYFHNRFQVRARDSFVTNIFYIWSKNVSTVVVFNHRMKPRGCRWSNMRYCSYTLLEPEIFTFLISYRQDKVKKIQCLEAKSDSLKIKKDKKKKKGKITRFLFDSSCDSFLNSCEVKESDVKFNKCFTLLTVNPAGDFCQQEHKTLFHFQTLR